MKRLVPYLLAMIGAVMIVFGAEILAGGRS